MRLGRLRHSQLHAIPRTAAVALAAGVALAGCGGEPPADPTGGAGPAGLGGVRIGKATCAEWREAGTEEQLDAVAQLEEAASAKPGQPGDTLAPEQAYAAIDRSCSTAAGRGFLLYEIYIRAAAFTP